MIYYVFKNVAEDGATSYGFVPEDKLEDKALADKLVFSKLENLPEPPANSEGKSYFLNYDEAKKKFYFKV